MSNYVALMYDIENYVFIPSSNKRETYNLINKNIKNFSQLSVSYYQKYNKVSEHILKFCDQ